MLEGFVKLFRHLYNVDESKFRCCLHLRKDQEEQELKPFWSKRLDIPESQFQKTQYDKRTTEPTYKDYKGTCVLLYFDVDLQRRILYIADNLIEKMIDL